MAKRSSKRRRREARTRQVTSDEPKRSTNPQSKRSKSLAMRRKGPSLSEGRVLKIVECEVTWEPLPSPEIDRLPKNFRDRIPDIHGRVMSHPVDMIDELKLLTVHHPEVDCFQNWLCLCYRAAREDAKARQLAERIVRERPDYFFGHIALAEICLDDGDTESAEQILGPVKHPKALFPHRTVFHVSEMRHYFFVAAKLHLMKGETDAARSCRDFLNEIDPDSATIKELDRFLDPKNAVTLAMAGLFRNFFGKRETENHPLRKPRRNPGNRYRKTQPPNPEGSPPAVARQGELFALEELNT